MVLYCSPECQEKDWKIHEPHCEIYAKTKLAAKQANQTNQKRTNKNKKSNFNETEENDGIL